MADAGSVFVPVPSPQSMVSDPGAVVKSASVESGFASVNVPIRIGPVEIPSLPRIVAPNASSGASPTAAVAVAVAAPANYGSIPEPTAGELCAGDVT